VALFGTQLPSTAATPDARLDYLRACASNDSQRVRRIVVDAALRGVEFQETRSVSAELQGGVAVRAPGVAETYEADRAYREGMLGMLGDLTQDNDPDVAEAALAKLVDRGYSFTSTYVWPSFVEVVSQLSHEQKAIVRRAAQGWLRIASRTENDADVETITELLALLETDDPMDRLSDLGAMPPWQLDRRETVDAVQEIVIELLDAHRETDLDNWIATESLAGGYLIGRALGGLPPDRMDDLAMRLVDYSSINFAVLHGFLDERDEQDAEPGRDPFLDNDRVVQRLTSEQLARLSMTEPPTERSIARIRDLVAGGSLSPDFAATVGLGRWSHHVGDAGIASLVEDWLPMVSQDSHLASLLDLVSLHLHREEAVPPTLEEAAWQLLEMRPIYLDLGNARWDWGEIATRLADRDPLRVVGLVVDVLRAGDIFLEGDPEGDLLRRAAEAESEAVWQALALVLEEPEGWRVGMIIEGWLLDSFDPGVIMDWVGSDHDRALLVANLTPVGRQTPGPLARELIVRFQDSDSVKARLAGQFHRGTFSGPLSSRLGGLIAEIEGWRDEPDPVIEWSRAVIEGLQADLAAARIREAERGY